ncbi:methyl-accepting chemotaxis protein [Agrobacterium arsenijevicii]|uniref:methyl-accepting chemotaxis protein n=1 Tax=Agrobacterium arsenijevicii TaxID=1585697 RepID=UPI0006982BEB
MHHAHSKYSATADKTVGTSNAAVPPIQERLEFMEMSAESRTALASIKDLLDRELPRGLDRFYAQVRKTPETMRFFSSEEHMTRAKGAQTSHWVNISNGDFTGSYGEKVRAIGTVHARIGLEPRWYIGGYAIVLDHLIKAAISENFPRARWFTKKSAMAPDAFGEALGSLAKAVLLDMDLAISVYLEEAEKAKQTTQTEAIEREQKIVSESFGEAIRCIAAKDLTGQVSGALPEAYHTLRDDLNASVVTLRDALSLVGENAASIDNAALDVSNAAAELSRRTEQQAASVEETAAAVEQIAATVNATARQAEEAGHLVARSRDNAERSDKVVQTAIARMGEIERSSREIANITEMMDEIAFQTNLLALNAGVEAARAGEAGKGFAVVAQEVRILAQRAAEAAKEIKSLITTSQQQVKSGVALVGETGHALQTIVADVNEINRHIAGIVDGAREQALGLQEINTAINSIDQGTQQNAAMAEQASAASQTLAWDSDRLTQLLAGFRLSDGHSGASARGLRLVEASPALPMSASSRRANSKSALSAHR